MTKKDVWDLKHSTMVLQREFDDKVEVERPLSDLNTFGTGGNARLFMEVRSAKELSSVMKVASKLNVPVFMLGGGSNVLISDSGYDGLILKNSIMGLERNGTDILCGAGESLQKLVDFAADNGLTGLEFAAGIWGTVGGAIYGNAGAYGSETGSVLKSAELVDRQGNIRNVTADDFEFSYRYSKLKETGEFVAGAIFALKMGRKEAIRSRVGEIISRRREKLPIGERSAGCFFKNIPDKDKEYGKLSTGRLLEAVGAKRMRYGGARVFENHANIIINNGTAKAAHIRRLADMMKAKVEDKFGIKLQEEIICLGNFEEDTI